MCSTVLEVMLSYCIFLLKKLGSERQLGCFARNPVDREQAPHALPDNSDNIHDKLFHSKELHTTQVLWSA